MTDSPYLLDPSVFRSFKLSIELRNFSSHSEVSAEEIELVEFSSDTKTITIEVPTQSASFGHNVLVTIHEIGLSKTPELLVEATGKVQAFEAVSPTQSKASIQLIQYEEKEFQKLLALFAKRQEEITKFMADSRD